MKSDYGHLRRLRIILRLGTPQLIILALGVSYQLLMCTGLDDMPLVEHGDTVAEAAGGQSVTDVDGGLVLYDLVELRVNLVLRDGV